MIRFGGTMIGLLTVALLTSTASAHTEFKKALQKKYDYRTVSCFACHMRKSDVPDDKQDEYKKNAKSFRNEFGQVLHEELKEKEITKRMADVKSLASDDPEKKKVKAAVTEEFLAALKKVEEKESSDGTPFGELLKSAKLDGVKPKK